MLKIAQHLFIPDHELEFSAIRAQGAGGQNVNKVSSALHLRFDVKASSLPEYAKQRVLSIHDQRLSKDGVIIIKAQQYRTQEQNKEDALARLTTLIQQAITVQKSRRPTKPTRNSQKRRLDRKTKHARTKALRGKVWD